jgi:hypothetical protein
MVNMVFPLNFENKDIDSKQMWKLNVKTLSNMCNFLLNFMDRIGISRSEG